MKTLASCKALASGLQDLCVLAEASSQLSAVGTSKQAVVHALTTPLDDLHDAIVFFHYIDNVLAQGATSADWRSLKACTMALVQSLTAMHKLRRLWEPKRRYNDINASWVKLARGHVSAVSRGWCNAGMAAELVEALAVLYALCEAGGKPAYWDLLKLQWAQLEEALEGVRASFAAQLGHQQQGWAGITEDTISCPITQEIMQDPVVCADGHTYERSAIAAWLAAHDTSPMTNQPLASKALIANIAVRQVVAGFLQHSKA
ncbi:hypothetical protein WJX72_002481 [[Myrmecia] bisecta]|uniref:U-box domain-containing protein n=1 Tax=[Myrmecia] bisecta TaxID=41462 RepID=A0AAW1R5G1_9CHLO